MEASIPPGPPLAAPTKSFARRLLVVGGNRLELLTVELQEELTRLLRALLLAMGVAVFGLLAGITLTATVAVVFWETRPWLILLVLAAGHGMAGGLLYRQLSGVLRGWEALSATFDQLRKDRACLDTFLS